MCEYMKKRASIVVAILLLAVGFAAISTTLIINGSTNVGENTEDFDVIFTAATLDGTDVYNTVIDSTKKIINFTTSDLKTLNQKSVLTYEVTNNSANYDAEVSVNCKVKDNGTAKYTSIENVLEGNATKILAKETLNGTLTVTLNKTATEEVTEEYTCEVVANAKERDELGLDSVSFADDSWETISKNVKSGNTDKYNVGDIKSVDLGSLGTHTLRLANKSECTNGETSETACGFVVEFADIITTHNMNSRDTNVEGWPASEARTYINSTILNALPSDLQKAIVSTKVISGHGRNDSSNFETYDRLYLLSSNEIYNDFSSSSNAQWDTARTTSRQLDYYKKFEVAMSNQSKAIKQYNETSQHWWLRTAGSDSNSTFLRVNDYGTLFTDIASTSYGISPAFRIA